MDFKNQDDGLKFAIPFESTEKRLGSKVCPLNGEPSASHALRSMS